MDTNADTKTQKATVKDSITAAWTLIWAISQPCMLIYLAWVFTPNWRTFLCTVLVGCFYLAANLVTSFRLESVLNLKKIRKHSPRAVFFSVFDADEEIQKLKRKAHCAETPQQFEEALAAICSRFYDEGYAVRDSA